MAELPPLNATVVAMEAVMSAVLAEMPRKRRARAIKRLHDAVAGLSVLPLRQADKLEVRRQSSELIKLLAQRWEREFLASEAA